MQLTLLRARLPWRPLQLLVAVLVAVQFAGCASPRLATTEQKDVAGKTFVVTGASSGFGRGVAERLGGMRANVVLAARRTDALNEVADRVKANGGNALVVTTDVSKPDDVARLASQAVAKFGRIDVWINNAGVGAIGPFVKIPIEDQARVVDVNLKSVIYGSQVALRQFQKQGGGTLVNMGSVESEVPLAYQATYAATKAAVLSLSRSLNEEMRLAGFGDKIAVATVMPWATDTPFFEHAANYSGGTPRMAMLDDPWKVVDAVVWVSVHPREELPTGWKASSAYVSHRVMPNVTERLSADVSQKVQMEDAPPAPNTSGNLYKPVEPGRGVDGGVRERMAKENAERKQAK